MIEEAQENGLPLFYFQHLHKVPDIKHYVSGKKGGVSGEGQDLLNISFAIHDKPENVIQNRKLIAESLEIDITKLIFPSQVHSSNIKVVNEANYKSDFSDTDALISNEKGICINVMSADCIPVLLYDPHKNAVAAIHAGWRGTMKGIVAKTVQAMKDLFGTSPENLLAGIGPGICQDKYEVGSEVVEAVENYYSEKEYHILLRPSKLQGKAYLDLWQANKFQLLKKGVKVENIELAEICTFSNPNSFFSARRALNEGRFSAGIMLN